MTFQEYIDLFAEIVPISAQMVGDLLGSSVVMFAGIYVVCLAIRWVRNATGFDPKFL